MKKLMYIFLISAVSIFLLRGDFLMGEEYNRVNWQDKPSTATPITADNLNKMDKGIKDLDNKLTTLNNNLTTNYATKAMLGSSLVASTYAEMSDTSKIYVYVGSEEGYTNGNWYYHNGTEFVSGGVYNASAVQTDKELISDGVSADAKATGDKISELKEDLYNLAFYNGGNLFDGETLDGYVKSKDGSIATSTTLCHTKPIKIKPNTNYVTYGALKGECGCVFDKNGKLLGTPYTIDTSISLDKYEFTIPYQNAYYVVFNLIIKSSTSNVTKDKFVLYEYRENSYPQNSVFSDKLMIDFSKQPKEFDGKNVVFFGDSRTWYDGHTYNDRCKEEFVGNICKGYQETVKEITGCNIISQGVSGETSEQICNRIRAYDFTNIDVVYLSGGVNDFVKSSQISMGNILPIGSEFNTTTVYGSWQSAIEYILTNYPSTKICIEIPAIAWTTDGVFPYETASVKKSIAELYNIPYIDLYKNGGISEINRDMFYCDDVSKTNWRLHFNDYGNEWLGYKIAKFILAN